MYICHSHYIAIAGSSSQQPSDIIVFRKLRRNPPLREPIPASASDNIVITVSPLFLRWAFVSITGLVILLIMQQLATETPLLIETLVTEVNCRLKPPYNVFVRCTETTGQPLNQHPLPATSHSHTTGMSKDTRPQWFTRRQEIDTIYVEKNHDDSSSELVLYGSTGRKENDGNW
ncbi:hypothetical protein BT96DRAFT_1010577 [Gymnopus androsaceus JB14]|uniref:Uncharacterized protein n=1 Tax=Gymnopus androsaceus JB14 TaxID=1447944 RepID=A0A6A4GAJ8_9AGAR|nr:hypothetical protein BT96DRAFT_1010577 [Gymnopus androsaceus JB14]